ncbi:MAG: rRNA maturation RNase YbeY [Cyclobacteriaceae bacterium]
MPIRFFEEGVSFKLPHPRKTSNWIKGAVTKEKAIIGELNYIFCQDSYLLSINQEYLNHDSFTDIITFSYPQAGNAKSISGDIFISIERVRDNARNLKIPFDSELHRVIIHGVLHLLGYRDKKVADKALMRKKEEAYLSLRKL